MQPFQPTANFLLILSSAFLVYATNGSWDACSGRLERALDTLHRESTKRNQLEEEERGINYQQELKYVPLDMTVSHISIKFSQRPRSASDGTGSWAKVEQCLYEPNDNSLRTRVIFHDLTVSGMVSLLPRNHQASVFSESCKMFLRFRRSGIDFFTSPIARRKGQVKIRTESSFLEPQFASMYAYGCHPNIRGGKQIKRQDKWPSYHWYHGYHNHHHAFSDKFSSLPISIPMDNFEVAEPRYLVDTPKEKGVIVTSKPQPSDTSGQFSANDNGLWKKNPWATKFPMNRRQSLTSNIQEATQHKESHKQLRSIVERIDAPNFAITLLNSRVSKQGSTNADTPNFNKNDRNWNIVNDILINDTMATSGRINSSMATELNVGRKNSHEAVASITTEDAQRSMRESSNDKNAEMLASDNRVWQSTEHVTREMEDIFLRSASQALTRYIEHQLHPAIKETLMLSMGYTISYG